MTRTIPFSSHLSALTTFIFLMIVSGIFVGVLNAQGYTESQLIHNTALQKVFNAQNARLPDSLAIYLSSDDVTIRAQASFGFGSLQDPTMAPKLLQLLKDSGPKVRQNAAFALGQLRTTAFATSIWDAFESEQDPRVKKALFIALGHVGTPETLEKLIQFDLSDSLQITLPLSVTRMALRNVVSEDGTNLMIQYLSSTNSRTRENAGWYFARPAKTDHWIEQAPQIRNWLSTAQSNDLAVMQILRGLGRLENKADTSIFIHWLKSATDWRITINAGRGLRKYVHHENVRVALIEGLSHDHLQVQFVMSQLLLPAELNPAELKYAEQLIESDSTAWQLQANLLPHFAEINPDFILNWIDKQTDSYRIAAGVLALQNANPNDPKLYGRLTNYLLSDQSNIRNSALISLTEFWETHRQNTASHDAYFNIFSDALLRQDPQMIETAVPVMADTVFRKFNVVDRLISSYNNLNYPADRDLYGTYHNVFIQIGDTAFLPALKTTCNLPDESIQQSAANAILRISGSAYKTTPPDTVAFSPIDWKLLAQFGESPIVKFETEKGEFVVQLDAEQAPATVASFLKMIIEKRYNNVPFHRVIGNFVAQGGDYGGKDGYGDASFVIKSEFTQMGFKTGTIGMASSGKDTEGSQFFICHSMQPHLDGIYTAFGYVISGQNVVDRLLPWDLVLSAEIIEY